MQQETERIRKHYEDESRKIQEAANALVAKTINDFEPLRKYEKLREAEAEAQRQLWCIGICGHQRHLRFT
jgi:membrane protein involved in colicin uptake